MYLSLQLVFCSFIFSSRSHPLPQDTWDCNQDLSQFMPIAAGSLGVIHKFNDNVIKAITESNGNECSEALEEYNKHHEIYTAFQELGQNANLHNFDIVQLANKYIRISELKGFCSKNNSEPHQKYTINNDQYNCYYVMSTLNGIKISDWRLILGQDAKEYLALDSEWIDSLQDAENYEIMAHLTFNGELNQFMGSDMDSLSDNHDYKISFDNLPRGFFLNENGKVLNELRENYNLHITKNEIKNIIGFLHGWIYTKTNMIPMDIEIALGLDRDKKWCINIMDFGQCILINTEENKVKLPPFWRMCKSLFVNDESKRQKKNEYIKLALNETAIFDDRVKAIISSDFYADVISDEEVEKGWDSALETFVSLKKRLVPKSLG